MNLPLILNALRSALKRRDSLFAETECLRLLNAEASGTPRLVFELYGKHAIAYDYGIGLGGDFQKTAPDWLQEFGWESIVLLDRSKPGDEGRDDSAVVAGDAPERLTVCEGTLHFLVEPKHPRNTGLFLDTRPLRKWLGENSRNKRILNLFAYTGSLGLAALQGGAAEVVQVDISDRYLDWGRENLRLNDLPAKKCRFTRMDSERYLDWAAKKGLAFDQIILDPPVFSRFDGKVFRFEDDYFRLASKAIALLAPGGVLYAVTNYSGITAFEFKRRLEDAATSTGRHVQDIRQMPLPSDFDIQPGSEERVEGNAMMFQIMV